MNRALETEALRLAAEIKNAERAVNRAVAHFTEFQTGYIAGVQDARVTKHGVTALYEDTLDAYEAVLDAMMVDGRLRIMLAEVKARMNPGKPGPLNIRPAPSRSTRTQPRPTLRVEPMKPTDQPQTRRQDWTGRRKPPAGEPA